MNIFLTGATGYIGSVLMRQLIDKGHIVHALYRPSSFNKVDMSDSQIQPFKGDLLNISSLERAIRGCDRVYHLAAYAKPWASDSSIYHNINVIGTRNVLKAAQKLDVDKVVITSSAATLPASTNGNPVDETATKSTFETEYARSKYLAEEEARIFNQKGLDTVIVNPSRVFGPGLMSTSNSVTKLIKWYIEGKWRFLPGGGRFVGNYTFVEDVARGHQKAMANGKPGHRYILGGENLSLAYFLQLVGKVCGKHRYLIPIPVSVFKAFAKAELWKAQKLGANPLITPQWVEQYIKDSPLSSRKAQTELGYNITPIEKSLEKTIQWLN